MTLDYPRFWHQGRTVLLVTWLLASASYLFLFLGATYTGEGIEPRRFLLGLLATQAALLLAALATHSPRFFSIVTWARTHPQRAAQAALALNAVLLVAMALWMTTWNDERHNMTQALYLGEKGLTTWIADYERVNQWLGLHHPPLLALLYGGFYGLAGPSLLAGRLFNIVFALLAMIVSRRLIARLTDAPTAALSLFAWCLLPLWLFNGAAAILEAPFLLVFMLTADALVAFGENPDRRRALKAGAWLTVALLCRYNVVLLLPGMVYLLFEREKRAALARPAAWWIAGLPLLVLAPVVLWAAGAGLLTAQAERLTWMALLLRPGGVHYLLETLLPLWPMHIGAQAVPFLALSFAALATVERRARPLLYLGGVYFFLVMLILPNPRYLVPAVPFLGAGFARLSMHLADRDGGETAVWLGWLAAALILVLVVTTGTRYDGFYPYY